MHICHRDLLLKHLWIFFLLGHIVRMWIFVFITFDFCSDVDYDPVCPQESIDSLASKLIPVQVIVTGGII